MISNFTREKSFQGRVDGKETSLFSLKNKNGMEAVITNYGGRVVQLLVPGPGNELFNVVVGFESLEQYQKSTEPYYGAVVGRYANRIAGGRFTLDGKEYSLLINNGVNSLHGGKKGYQYVVWDVEGTGDSTISLSYLCLDGEEGFPGNLVVKVTYSVSEQNEFRIDYEAITDKKTIINLTNHSFFNLNGAGSGTINNHLVTINADRYTPVNSEQVPTGEIASLTGSPLDFRIPVTLGSRIHDDEIQLKYGKGYDHNYVININEGENLHFAAEVWGDQTAIGMQVYTTEPGVQFYGGNSMEGKNCIREGKKDDYRTAFCLETQHFPDSPNHPSFPSTDLRPGEIFRSSTIYKFSSNHF